MDWVEARSAGDGEYHVINAIRGKTYYIKCMDEFGNAPTKCSAETVLL